jgi:tight adherence protein B
MRGLALICLFAAVVLASEVLVRWLGMNRTEAKAIQWRLKMIGRGREQTADGTVLRRNVATLPEGLPAQLRQSARKLERMLLQAHLHMELPRLVLLLLLAPGAIFFGLLLLMAMKWGIGISFGRIVITASFAIVLGTMLPLMALNWRANRNRKKVDEQFPVALDIFVRGLRAGHPIASALDLLTAELPEPIGPEFGVVVDEVSYGAELRDALQSLAERWDSDDIRMFVVSIAVQSETGGNLAEVLENLSKVIRDRHAMMLKVRALSSEGRMTGIVLTVLPLFTFALLFTFNARFFLDVANDQMFVPGFAFLGVLYTIGFVMIRRMVDLKV